MHKHPSQSELDRILRTRIIGWGVRWTIGFAIILIATARMPELGWLWPVGVTISLLSLGVIVIMSRRMRNLIARSEKAQDELARIRAQSEAEEG